MKVFKAGTGEGTDEPSRHVFLPLRFEVSHSDCPLIKPCVYRISRQNAGQAMFRDPSDCFFHLHEGSTWQMGSSPIKNPNEFQRFITHFVFSNLNQRWI